MCLVLFYTHCFLLSALPYRSPSALGGKCCCDPILGTTFSKLCRWEAEHLCFPPAEIWKPYPPVWDHSTIHCESLHLRPLNPTQPSNHAAYSPVTLNLTVPEGGDLGVQTTSNSTQNPTASGDRPLAKRHNLGQQTTGNSKINKDNRPLAIHDLDLGYAHVVDSGVYRTTSINRLLMTYC